MKQYNLTKTKLSQAKWILPPGKMSLLEFLFQGFSEFVVTLYGYEHFDLFLFSCICINFNINTGNQNSCRLDKGKHFVLFHSKTCLK